MTTIAVIINQIIGIHLLKCHASLAICRAVQILAACPPWCPGQLNGTLTPNVNLAVASVAGNLLEDIIFSIVGYTETTEEVGHDV